MFAPTVCGRLSANISSFFVALTDGVRRLTSVISILLVDLFCQPETAYAFDNFKKTDLQTSKKGSKAIEGKQDG